jgi:hypothetical protein
MAWPIDPRPAKSLITLRNQVDALSPHRDKSSDGMLASAPHHVANPNSDHEPHVMDGAIGVVTALDITNDPGHGINSETLAEALRTAQDSRIKYLISNRKIASGTGQGQPAWQWRPYTGVNPHDHHCHISVKAEPAAYDSTAPWTINMVVQPGAANAPITAASDPVLQEGTSGADVRRMQTLLNAKGIAVGVDGIFGSKTADAVKAFQSANNLVADGVCGRHTWDALKA